MLGAVGRAAPLEEPSALVGISLSGGYRVVRLLDASGFGVVFEATDPAGRRIALKVLRREVVTEDTLSRLSREASVTSKIDNRHIVPIFDAGNDLERDLAYVVMPLLEGIDVGALLARTGPLPPATAVRIALQVAAGLSAVHAAGIVYRDVRPSRIFLETRPDGEVTARVFGFGLPKGEDPASALVGRSRNGERIQTGSKGDAGEGADPRVDVFGLGASLYEMLSGAAPWAELDVTPDTEDFGPDGSGPEAQPAAPQFPSIQDRAPWVQAKLAASLTLSLMGEIDRRHPSIEAFAEALRASGITQDAPAGAAGGDDRIMADMLRPLDLEERAQSAERADAETDPLVGRELCGRYAVRRLIGRGGMGAVYEAQASDGRRIAAKVIFRAVAGQDDQAVRRFIREARAVTAIQSPHVVKTFELGTDITLGSPFIIMELLAGIDLAKLLRQRGPMEPAPLLRVFIQAARGLASAHAEGIVHRDIKPANLFLHLEVDDSSPPTTRGIAALREDRRIIVKVCDFGIAKRLEDGGSNDLTRAGGVLGSPIYMSPEQAKQAKDVDRRSDVWSLSVSLYQALCGSCPWDPNASLAELLLAICTERVPPLLEAAPWLEPGLAADVHRGLMSNPAERWQTMEEMIAALERHAGGDVVTLGELRPIDAERRAQATPIAKLRADSKQARFAEGDERSISGSAVPADAAPADAAPTGSGRRRVVGALAAVAAVAAVAGVVALRGSTSGATAGTTPGAAAGGDRGAPSAEPGAGGPGAAARTDAVAAMIAATVEVPADAVVRVNGEVREVTGGRLDLSGHAGDVFEVEVMHDGAKKTVKVVMTSDGKAEPDHIELAAALTVKPKAARTAAPSAQAPPTAATMAPTSVKPVDHW